MSHYKSNLRDIQFNLFEVLRRQDLLGQPPYDELDEETVRGILGELERMACSWLLAAGVEAMPVALRGVVDDAQWRRVGSIARSGFASPLTSSVGRLFDAVAALCGVRAVVTYEGQAAVEP